MTLSVITVTRNNRIGLEKTLASLEAQRGTKFELIIVDGKSSDGSVALLRDHQGIITRWVSEPDDGIYDAMNKAVRMASGDFCLFLNAGDSLLDENSIDTLSRALDNDHEVFFSDLIYIQEGRRQSKEYPVDISPSFFLTNTLNHQNCVIKRTTLLEEGLYRTDFRVASDWFFFAKGAVDGRMRFNKLDVPIAIYENDGWSASNEGARLNIIERERGLQELFGTRLPLILELATYRDSVYGSIVRNFGEGGVLIIILRIYRFIMRILYPRRREYIPRVKVKN